MFKCFIYSGYTREWETRQKQHHKDILGDAVEVHYNENNANLDFYNSDAFGYSSHKYDETVPCRVLNMWHNMWQAFSKAPTGLDIYVKMRYDIAFSEPIDLASYEFSDSRVYVPTSTDWREGLNDLMAFGNYESMRKYYSVYLTHQMFFSQGKIFHPERYLKHTLEHLGVEVIRIPQMSMLPAGPRNN